MYRKALRLLMVYALVAGAARPVSLLAESPGLAGCAQSPCAGSCGADSCCEGCDSSGGYVSVEALIFGRDNRTSRLAAIRVQGEGKPLPGTPVLNTSELNFEWQPGVRTVVGRRCDDCQSLELGYFGIFGWSATAQAAA